jgi:leader peptidase (prepilin peptidase)/N-methyltransferase
VLNGIANGLEDVLWRCTAAAAGFLLVVLVGWAYRYARGFDGIGLGDAKLLAVAGAWVSLDGLSSVVLIATVAALSIVLLSTAKRTADLSWTERVPFGAYLCLGTWLVWLYGPLEQIGTAGLD